jgi:hypothetical protein
MEHEPEIVRTPARNAALTLRYARVWKAIICCETNTTRADLAKWYGAAQHAIGICMHVADVDRVVLDAETGTGDVRHAA